MKKTISSLVMVLALVSLVASFAMADNCADKPAKKIGDMGKCCIESAVAGKACCGKSAEEVKAKYAMYQSVTAVKADMHKCCAEALGKDKGCCDKSAKELRADYEKKVAAHCETACKAQGIKAKDAAGCAAAVGCVKTCGSHAKAGCGAKVEAEAKKACAADCTKTCCSSKAKDSSL